MPYKEEIVHAEIKDGLPSVMQEEVKEKFGSYYRTIPTKYWISLLGNLGARDDRSCAACEAHYPDSKKKETVSLSLWFLTINTILTPDSLNNRRPLSIAVSSAIVSSARRQGTPSTGTSITPVRNEIHLIIPIPRKTWMDV